MFLGFKDQSEVMPDMLEALSKANELNDNDWNTNRILAEANLTMNDFEQTKVYATKAYKANPNNPHVLSIYGESLLRNGDTDTAIKIFEKMYELEPIVAADTNSDRPLQAILFAYYMNNDLDKCKELLTQLDDFTSKTWLALIDLHHRNNKDYIQEDWFIKGMNKYRNLNWKNEIKSFHLNNKDILENLSNMAANLA